jgi:hypothetical protein
VVRVALKIFVNSGASIRKVASRLAGSNPVCPVISSQKPVSSASAKTMVILLMKFAGDLAR